VTERFSNEWSSSLATAINASQTSFALTSAPPAALSSGNWRIRVDNEYMLVTGVSGVTVTVTRGAESTTAVSHAILADVSNILTAGGLQQAITEAGTGAHPATAVGSTDPTLATVTITLLANPTVSIPTSAGSDIEVEVRMTTSSTGADSINLYVRNDGGSWVLTGTTTTALSVGGERYMWILETAA
jgi:hypothetical protein